MFKLVFPFCFFAISFSSAYGQYELFDPKGSKKVKVETMNYYQNDSTLSIHVLNFNGKGNLVKNTKFDQSNDPLEVYSFSYKFSGDHVKYSEASFKDYTKALKNMKYKIIYTYDANGKLQRVENTKSGNGFEILYDSIGRFKSRSEFNLKGFYAGSSFTYQNGLLLKQKYEQSGKPPEVTEFVYDSQGRLITAFTYRAKKMVRKEKYTYEG